MVNIKKFIVGDIVIFRRHELFKIVDICDNHYLIHPLKKVSKIAYRENLPYYLFIATIDFIDSKKEPLTATYDDLIIYSGIFPYYHIIYIDND